MIFKYNSTHTEFKIFLKFSWFILYSKKEKKKNSRLSIVQSSRNDNTTLVCNNSTVRTYPLC